MGKQNNITTISIIGSGNVATSLGITLANAGLEIIDIYSRTKNNARLLAKKLECNWVEKLEDISHKSDLYLVAISDDQITDIASNLKNLQGIVAHTSGSQGLEVISKHTIKSGVFYPLQTMTKSKTPDFADIPICIESDHNETKRLLTDLAKKISNNVVHLDSMQRQYLHLTAVTVNNFTNLLYNHAHDVLREKEIDFSLLLPLIKETAKKVHRIHPEEAQTGPARRNDKVIIDKHLELLKDYPEYQDVYTLLSKQLIRKYHEKL